MSNSKPALAGRPDWPNSGYHTDGFYAEALGISERRFRDLAHQLQMPALKVGATLLLQASDVIEAIRNAQATKKPKTPKRGRERLPPEE